MIKDILKRIIMKLTVTDRVLMPSILPRKGRLIQMLLVEAILAAIKFTAEEITEFELKDVANGGVTFNRLKAKETEVSFSVEQLQIMNDAVNKLDDDAEVSLELLSLIKKIRNI